MSKDKEKKKNKLWKNTIHQLKRKKKEKRKSIGKCKNRLTT